MKIAINGELIPALIQLQPEYVNDAYAKTLEQVFARLRDRFNQLDIVAQQVATSFVENGTEVNKTRFYKSIENAIGIDISRVIQNENLEDIIVATTSENINLIRSIPEQYFKQLQSVVYTGTTQGRNARSMIKEIQKIGGVTERRAKLIARDQTAKLNSALNQQRQQNLGVTEYIWRTAQDDRVRDNHASKNGKVFRWDDPPSDTGHPGQDIQCRCVAQPIIQV